MYKLVIIVMAVTILTSCDKAITDQEDAISLIASHYNFGANKTKLSIDYGQLSFNAYQSYDYRNPDSIFLTNHIELDDEKNQFYAYRTAVFPGEFKFTLHEFQKDTTSVRFDDNLMLLGKEAVKQDLDRIDQVKKEMGHLIDFQIVNALFSSQKDSIRSNITVENGNAVIVHKGQSKDSMEYSFTLDPVQLKKVIDKSKNWSWEFEDMVNKNGLSYARSITHFRNDKFRNKINITEIKEIDGIQEKNLEIPDGFKYQDDAHETTPQSYAIGKDLFLVHPIAGDRNIMFKVNDNKITIFGAPLSDRFSKQVIDLIKAKFPKKEIRGVYVTHAHSDHIGGLQEYAKAEIPIIADEFSIEAIKAYPKFQKTIDSFSFINISHKELANGIQYFIVETPHCLSQSFVYFPDSKVIYQGDFIEIPNDNTIPSYMPETTAIFIKFLRNESIEFTRIVGHHRNNNISPETVNNYFGLR